MSDNHLILAEPDLGMSPDQWQLIRNTFANGASEEEFAVLMAVAKARRLNPLLRQIYFVKRWDKVKRTEVWSCQASIDGLRTIAERSGRYNGQDEPEFITDEKSQELSCCKVKVYRKDFDRPTVGVAYWSEYAQYTKEGKLTHFWAEKPHIMLSKCAEALALRKAFPEDMSGLYVPEEMGKEAAVIEAPVANITKEDLVSQIAQSQTVQELKETGRLIKKRSKSLSLDDIQDLREAYDIKQNDLLGDSYLNVTTREPGEDE